MRTAKFSRDHNATSYSTETDVRAGTQRTARMAEIITLRAIALKLRRPMLLGLFLIAEIITLRAIALKLHGQFVLGDFLLAEIITLRAIALKLGG